MDEETFYQEIARYLGTTHDYNEPPPVPSTPNYEGLMRNTYKNRWNGRTPGNGRFPGHGIVRIYGSECIHVALTDPPLSGQYPSLDAALNAIWCAMGEKLTRDAHAEIDELLHDEPCRYGPEYWERYWAANAAARAAVQKAGVTIHPKIAAARARRKNDDQNS